MTATVALVGTFDTKGVEYDFIRQHIDAIGACSVLLVDVGIQSDAKTAASVDITSKAIVEAAGGDVKAFEQHHLSKTDAFDLMSTGLAAKLDELHESDRLHGILALGGSCGTSIVSEALQRAKNLPIGLPKLIVSTIAASSSAPTAVGLSDVTLMHSVTDIGGGVNRINEPILANAAAGISAMASRYYESKSTVDEAGADGPPLIALTMFGVTTPCVLEAKKQLEELGYDTVVFHATGVGGRAMEQLIERGSIHGLLDITTTELADELVGGILSAGPARLEMAGRKGIPHVVSLGALDMVNFGSRQTVPEEFVKSKRLLHEHNSQVTLMRTTSDECAKLGEIIAKKLNQQKGSDVVRMFVPRAGISLISGIRCCRLRCANPRSVCFSSGRRSVL